MYQQLFFQNVEGVDLQIPMPGHVVGDSMLESTKQAVAKLEELYTKHDVVFLLLDSREARWLPTVMCAAHDKVAINAALGFDSYTVQRHGTRNEISDSTPSLTNINPPGKDLGCYFCNDVTQPGNVSYFSLKQFYFKIYTSYCNLQSFFINVFLYLSLLNLKISVTSGSHIGSTVYS